MLILARINMKTVFKSWLQVFLCAWNSHDSFQDEIHISKSKKSPGVLPTFRCLSHFLCQFPIFVKLHLHHLAQSLSFFSSSQMWTSVWQTPTAASPASAVWTQWVHLYAGRSSVLQATSWGTVCVRVSSLCLMYFVRPIYPESRQCECCWCLL